MFLSPTSYMLTSFCSLLLIWGISFKTSRMIGKLSWNSELQPIISQTQWVYLYLETGSPHSLPLVLRPTTYMQHSLQEVIRSTPADAMRYSQKGITNTSNNQCSPFSNNPWLGEQGPNPIHKQSPLPLAHKCMWHDV